MELLGMSWLVVYEYGIVSIQPTYLQRQTVQLTRTKAYYVHVKKTIRYIN